MQIEQLLEELKKQNVKYLSCYGNVCNFAEASIVDVYDLSEFKSLECNDNQYTSLQSGLTDHIQQCYGSIGYHKRRIEEIMEDQRFTQEYKITLLKEQNINISDLQKEIEELENLKPIKAIYFKDSATFEEVEIREAQQEY